MTPAKALHGFLRVVASAVERDGTGRLEQCDAPSPTRLIIANHAWKATALAKAAESPPMTPAKALHGFLRVVASAVERDGTGRLEQCDAPSPTRS
ncbi:hypothetical protein RhiTH_011253 [Rhizoctonia solani]